MVLISKKQSAKIFFDYENQQYCYYSLASLEEQQKPFISTLPFSIRVLLESLLRQKNGTGITEEHIEQLAKWSVDGKNAGEVPFKPARVILQDFTGVPAIVDLASLRKTIADFGGDPTTINPEVPVDLVIDHSVQVDVAGVKQALQLNMKMEFQRNQERYRFLSWAQKVFDNYRVVPPTTGIVHQVNVEYLASVVTQKKLENDAVLLYPDTLVGTDSHTTMVNALGVLGWGVGGIEAEASMLGEPSYFPIPEVVGVCFVNDLSQGATATDLALKVTQVLRKQKVVGKFVEFFGPGLANLSLADRATVANMAPEYGATCGFFPVDNETIRYLRLTGRAEKDVRIAEHYLKENQLFYDPVNDPEPNYTKVIEIDLNEIKANLAGPKRPQDLIPLAKMKNSFDQAIKAPNGLQGFGLSKEQQEKIISLDLEGEHHELKPGAVTIAAITSCTNTSNPFVMLSAGLVAKKAAQLGLHVPNYVKTSLAPGSKVVTAYLKKAGLLPYLEQLGFHLVGYGCTTCIGNSGALKKEVEEVIKENDLLTAGVLSGNRNFEGRIHPLVKANYLASPPLVVLYALAGTVDIDVFNEPIGIGENDSPIYFNDLWPSRDEIQALIDECVTPELYQEEYAQVFSDNEEWNGIETNDEPLYGWEEESTYIANPPYFTGMTKEREPRKPLRNLAVLAKFGDSVTTDHLSPAGSIQKNSPAGQYLINRGVEVREFNSYGARRGHHEVMMRGTLANIRIRNQLVPNVEGGYTIFAPTQEKMAIYDAAMNYQKQGTKLVVLAGDDYGMGSSRDWAAKGVQLLGVEAVIAKSYERIHRSNLVMMGVLPLQFKPGEDADSLGLTGTELFDIDIDETKGILDIVNVTACKSNGETIQFETILRFDSAVDITYYQHGGILPMVIRKKL
ncbi:aconitate hydratase AcnA [Enterococcus termitis]|uniref:Aconitate hydratase n=1 Tax=Enterococcus termitis TaxID=332950 RepID=A0A1E5H6Q2_9ENTE|nr:aconitate hydratase AcnA [Enterococcus termitis]OEG20601.1 aconitate hydratase 1 [Enterococcus termitis]OJG99835.1 aconitate hydratase 1 [Enterococcus termitis]